MGMRERLMRIKNYFIHFILLCLWRWYYLVWKARSLRRHIITTTLCVIIIRNLLLSGIKMYSERAISEACRPITDAFGKMRAQVFRIWYDIERFLTVRKKVLRAVTRPANLAANLRQFSRTVALTVYVYREC